MFFIFNCFPINLKAKNIGKVIISVLLFLFISKAISSPPDDPVHCTSKNTNCTITNSYGTFPDRSTCKAAQVLYPTTEQELVSMVAAATKNNRKMKTTTRYSHSIPKLVCPDGEDGVLISTNKLNRVLDINAEERTMVVESGVTLRQVIREAAAAGLALPHTPYWWGLTMGGLLATGAHGSSLWGRGSAVHEYVVKMRIVSPGKAEDGYAVVRTLKESDDDLNAVKVSLGVLGVVSQITLKLEPLFKRSLTYMTKDDSDLGDEIVSFGKQHEFGDAQWYPTQQKVIYRVDDRVSNDTSGNGLYDFTAFRPTLSAALAAVRTTEEIQEATNDANGKCVGAKLFTTTLHGTVFGLTNNGIIFTGYPVIGLQNRMQSSGTCLDILEDALITACPWDSRVKGQFFHHTAVSIPLSSVKSFIEDVKKLNELEPQGLCGVEINNGILMRYVKASSAYLGKTEDAVDFYIAYYRSKDPLAPRLYEDILEEIEQMGIFKYGGLPHWGKNRNVAFDGVIKKYHNGGKFLSVKKAYDPQELFSSEWTDQILGLKDGVTIVRDGCALEGLCICSQDSHCAPSKGYYCKPGRVYKEARICTRRPSDLREEL